MWSYIARRILLTIPTVLGIVLLTFILFSLVSKDPARAYAGKQASETTLRAIEHKMGLDKPKHVQFFDLLFFRFPQSMRYEDSVWHLLKTTAPVSLAIQIPAFLILLGLELATALSVAALPILCVVFSQLGWGARFYRTVVLDELNSDYVRTARAKGLPQREVMLTHVLRNVMIPVVTNTIAALPFLILGALVLEHLFQIPVMGELIVQSIFNQDRSVVMGIVYLTSIAYCIALLVNDILYAIVDPRISLK